MDDPLGLTAETSAGDGAAVLTDAGPPVRSAVGDAASLGTRSTRLSAAAAAKGTVQTSRTLRKRATTTRRHTISPSAMRSDGTRIKRSTSVGSWIPASGFANRPTEAGAA